MTRPAPEIVAVKSVLVLAERCQGLGSLAPGAPLQALGE